MKWPMRLKQLAFLLAAILSPSAATPRAEREKGAPPVPVEQGEFPGDADFDEDYQGEPFYRGLPIFDKDGERSTLHPGKDYVEGQMQLPSGDILMCWRERGHKPVAIDLARVPRLITANLRGGIGDGKRLQMILAPTDLITVPLDDPNSKAYPRGIVSVPYRKVRDHGGNVYDYEHAP